MSKVASRPHSHPARTHVRVAAPGFTEASQHVNVGDGAQALHEIVLQVEGLRESVSVTAATGYEAGAITSATKTPTPLRDVPQSVTVVTQELIKDQLMMSIGDVVRYVPGITAHQGENNRDQVIIRGNSSSADFFVERRARRRAVLPRPLQPRSRRGAQGAERDDLRPRRRRRRRQPRHQGGAGSSRVREVTLQGGVFGNKRVTADLDQPLSEHGRRSASTACTRTPTASATASTSSVRRQPDGHLRAGDRRRRSTLGYEYLHDTRVADRGITSFQGRPADVDAVHVLRQPGRQPRAGRASTSPRRSSSIAPARVTIRNRTLVGDYDRFYQNFVPGAVNAGRQPGRADRLQQRHRSARTSSTRPT